MCLGPIASAGAVAMPGRHGPLPSSFFTMSNSPPRCRAAHLVPAAHFLRPGCRVVVLCPPHLRCLGRRFGGARAQILGVSCSSDPEMRGRRSAGRRTTSVRRAGKTRPSRLRGVPVPRNRDVRLSALHRGDLRPGPRCVSGISAGAGARLARRHRSWPAPDPGFDRGYEPRPTPHPAPPVRIVSGDAPHERG